MADIVVDSISRFFGPVAALDRVSFELPSGRTAAVIGPNGAGKSTLLECLAGVQLPDEGLLTIGKWNIAAADQYRACRRAVRIGYLPQQSLLYDDLTIRENLSLFAGLHGIDDNAAAAVRAAERFGIEKVLDRRVGFCSQGVVRRAGAARALLGAPGLLLLDEPFAHLDEEGRQRLAEQLQELQDKGATIVLATHLTDIVEQLAQVVLSIEGGRLVERSETDNEPEQRLQ